VGQTFYALLPTVQTMIAGGTAPDTLRVGGYSAALFAARDALLPLDDFIANDPDVNWDDFYPGA
jgi:ABC-type glycerol-3-phosphate transport system substrate-binding protein